VFFSDRRRKRTQKLLAVVVVLMATYAYSKAMQVQGGPPRHIPGTVTKDTGQSPIPPQGP